MVPSAATAAQELGTPHVLAGDRQQGPAAGLQRHADIAATPWGSIVVWEDERVAMGGTVGAGGEVYVTDILAARFDHAGRLLDDEPIVISRAPFSQTDPKVAWNGSMFLVLWESEALTTFYKSRNVVAARVSAGGQLLDPTPIVIDDEEYVDEHPWDVASDGNEFLVIWQDTSNNGNWSLDGALIDSAGGLNHLGMIYRPADQFWAPWNARLEWSGSRYLTVWSSWSGGVEGQLWDSAINKVGSRFKIGGAQSTQPQVATDGAGFYVTWGVGGTWGEVRGTPVSSTGQVGVLNGELLTPGYYPIDPHPSPAWDGAQWQVLWEEWAGAAGFSILRTRVDRNGGVIGAPDAVSAQGAYATRPVASAGPNQIFAVWEDGRHSISGFGEYDLYGSLLDSTGAIGAHFPVTVSAPAQLQPDLALADGLSTALVVFQRRVSGEAWICAQRVDAFGRSLDRDPIVLAQGSPEFRNPHVAWNSAQQCWMVVWEDYRGSVFQSRILGRRVSLNGTTLDPAALDLLPGNTPDVSAAGDSFLVVSTHEPINHTRTVKAARVSAADGSLIDPTPLVVSGSYARSVEVEAHEDRYVVTWQRNFSHDSPYAHAELNWVLLDGTLTGALHPIVGGINEYQPAVAPDGDHVLLTWRDADEIRGMRLRQDGTVLDGPTGFLISGASNSQLDPAVVHDGQRWWTAWTDWRAQELLEPGIGDIYATEVDAAGAVGTPNGEAVAVGDAAQGDVAVDGARGQLLAAYVEHHPEQPFGSMRVTLRGRAPQLDVTPLKRGLPASLTVRAAQPGDTALYIWSRQGRGWGASARQLDDLGIDLALPIVRLGSATVAASGEAVLSANVPATAPLGLVTFQVLLQSTPLSSSGKSDLAVGLIEP